MNRSIVCWGAVGLVVLASVRTSRAQEALGTAFTYQGRLEESGSPVNATADFEFSLFDAETSGNLVAGPISVSGVAVADGLFTVQIDFGASAFNGEARWLEIAARSPAGSGTFSTLDPRQELTAAPYARFAPTAPWTGLTGVPAGFADGIDNGSGDGHSLDAADGSPVDALFVDNAGNVGIGTTVPARPLHIAADAAALRLQDDDDAASYSLLEDWQPGIMRLMKFTGIPGTSLIDVDPMPSDGVGVANVRVFRATDTTGNKAMVFYRGNNTNEAHAAIGVDGASSYFQLGGGNVGIGTFSPAHKLDVNGGPISVTNQGDQADALWLAIERSWVFRQEGTGASTALKLQSQGGGGNKNFLIQTDGFVGIGTLNPQAKLDVNGTARAKVVEITGADLAEKFPASEVLEPGKVVAIDPQNPGKMCLARGAYNRCVAGVVSGANDFAAGAILGNQPGQEDSPPIALSGRVYVQCDATRAPIQPGDLLTTSDTPGHAMKALDRERSHGAVIGKAMTELGEGQGMVLVLVNLQ